jgi:sensor domain CHASE-containing protein
MIKQERLARQAKNLAQQAKDAAEKIRDNLLNEIVGDLQRLLKPITKLKNVASKTSDFLRNF